MFLIYFIFQFQGYFSQTTWTGDTGQLVWSDTVSYFQSYKVDGKSKTGQLNLCTPSGLWMLSDTLPKLYQVNAITSDDSGAIYIGGNGIDSSRLFKLENRGGKILFQKLLTRDWDPGPILSMVSLSNGNIVIGTGGRGDIFLLEDDSISHKLYTGLKVQCLCQIVNQVYAGTVNGKVFIGKFLGAGWSLEDTGYSIPNTKNTYCIFKASDNSIYATTQSTSNKGQIFKLLNKSWVVVYTFNNVEAIYSICEGPDNALYVSTGPQGKIYISKDNGSTWQEIPSPSPMADFYNILCDSTNKIYVSGECRGTLIKGMAFSSNNDGAAWDTIFQYPTGALPTTLRSMFFSKEGFLILGGDTNVCFISGYEDSGWLVSSIYDVFSGLPRVNKSLKMRKLHFEHIGDSVIFRCRSGPDIDSMSAWGYNVPNDSNPVNYGGIKDGDRYLQYMVKLSTDSFFKSPTLSEFYIKYELDVEGPTIDTAILSDSLIEWDDYVLIYFNEPTNQPRIETSNIDSILKLNNGHSWRSDAGKGVIKKPGEWLTPSLLKIYLSTLRIGEGEGYPPTIEVGDTIYPDSFALQDTLGNPCNTAQVIRKMIGIYETDKGISSKLLITPNPFNKIAMINYVLPANFDVSLKVYDCTGRLIKVIVNEKQEKGSYSTVLNSNGLARGIYFTRFSLNNKVVSTQKLILTSTSKRGVK